MKVYNNRFISRMLINIYLKLFRKAGGVDLIQFRFSVYMNKWEYPITRTLNKIRVEWMSVCLGRGQISQMDLERKSASILNGDVPDEKWLFGQERVLQLD